MKLTIITGGSRGLGYFLVKEYAKNGYKVISISRNKIDFTHANLILNIEFDLSKTEEYNILKKELGLIFKKKEISEVLLINKIPRRLRRV
jgi:benzil reductase ((S)-benzoin forming)